MTSTQVQELPLNNRNFVQLATLAPGVSSDLADEVGVGLTSTVSISINGGRRNAVNWLVDGVSNVDVGSNITLLSTPTPRVDRGVQDHHQQLPGRVAAQRRRHRQRRDQVAARQRFAGSAYEFLRSDKLNANSFFRNRSTDPAIEQRAAGAEVQQLRRHGGRAGRSRARCSSSSRRSCAASTARRPSLDREHRTTRRG